MPKELATEASGEVIDDGGERRPSRQTPLLEKDGRHIARMFDAVAPRYDLLNRTLSMGVDNSWRRALVAELSDVQGPVVDLCTGTGDVMLAAAQAHPHLEFVGLDFAPEMVKRGARKSRGGPGGTPVTFAVGDATSLGVASGSAGAVTIAFGIRNVADVGAALGECYRVLRRGGRIIVLEFSLPRNRALRAGYLFYFRRVLPVVGGIISGVRAAYEYLPMSVMRFPEGGAFLDLLGSAGFADARQRRLSFGIASLYVAEKP